ncbi:MAG TPA: SDR family oxidoreductase [Gammaproteobacteria bacterium]
MDLGLRGKNAVITGSSQGLGLAIATSLAKEGCNVALSGRDQARLESAAAALREHGVKVVAVAVDLSQESGCREFVARAAAELGGIDILVNNVGGMVPGTLESLGPEQWQRALDVKLMAAVYTTKHALPHLRKGRSPRVLNVSGVTGRQLMPGALTTSVQNSSIIAFSKVMAGELASAGITVNNICPGFTNVESWNARAEAMAKVRGTTPDQVRAGIASQTLLGRWAEPHEIGDVAAFLVSERASYITGATIEVDGGFTRYI